MTANDCIELLKQLIATPRTSRNETEAADLLEAYMRQQGMQPQRHGNNIWEITPGRTPDAPTILLNAHIDTVKPVSAWTRDPFTPTIETLPNGDQRLYGLGANDDGASLVTLLATYLHFRNARHTSLSPATATSLSPATVLDASASGPSRPTSASSLSPATVPDASASVPSAPTSASSLSPATVPDASASAPSGPTSAGFRDATIIFLASCEEEVSGANGISSVLPLLPPVEVAVVGEPTGMQPAIAEKGLMVLDCTAHGRAGHAARNEGDNAILHAIDDIQHLRNFQFPEVSPLLGPVKLTTTIIQAGTQHNVIPDQCTFTVDVRSNECYSNQQIYDILCQELHSDVKARSFRLNSSRIDIQHPLVQRAIELGRTPFGSPTLSDQALMPFPSMKMGPGDSRRSHTADEYILISEIEEALSLYRQLLSEP